MKVLVCVEDRGGMMFNGRRQSRDRLVTLDMLVEAGKDKLYITPFSEKLFRGNMESIRMTGDLFELAGKNATILVEDHDLYGTEELVDTLVIYRWNRVYPYDMTLAIDLEQYEKVTVTEFAGYSHDLITKETYVRKDLIRKEAAE